MQSMGHYHEKNIEGHDEDIGGPKSMDRPGGKDDKNRTETERKDVPQGNGTQWPSGVSIAKIPVSNQFNGRAGVRCVRR